MTDYEIIGLDWSPNIGISGKLLGSSTAVLMLSLVAESGGTLELWNAGLSLRWLLLLWSMGSRVCGLQQLQHTGLAAPWHVGSSQIKE